MRIVEPSNLVPGPEIETTVLGFISAFLYNVVAGVIGSIEVDVE